MEKDRRITQRGFWIPAFAGMTGTGVEDVGFGRDQALGAGRPGGVLLVARCVSRTPLDPSVRWDDEYCDVALGFGIARRIGPDGLVGLYSSRDESPVNGASSASRVGLQASSSRNEAAVNARTLAFANVRGARIG